LSYGRIENLIFHLKIIKKYTDWMELNHRAKLSFTPGPPDARELNPATPISFTNALRNDDLCCYYETHSNSDLLRRPVGIY